MCEECLVNRGDAGATVPSSMADRTFSLSFHSDVDYWYDSFIPRSQRLGNSAPITFYHDFWLQHLDCGHLAHLTFLQQSDE